MTTRSASRSTPFQPAPAQRVGPVVVATPPIGGRDVVRTGAALAARFGVEAVFVSVLEYVPPFVGGTNPSLYTPNYDRILREERRLDVEGMIQEAVGDIRFPLEVRVGDAARELRAAALERHATLLVAGGGRHELPSRLLVGETALRVIARAPCPVLVVHGELPPVIDTVVAAIDLEPSSVEAARAALRLLGDRGTLHLVHVWQPVRELGRPPEDRQRAHSAALADRLERIAGLIETPPGVTVERTVLIGETAEALADFARSVGAQLVAAGRRAHGFLERLLVGRVTTALVRMAPCAVLVTPQPSAARSVEIAWRSQDVVRSERPEEWVAMLDAFGRRNDRRRVLLEVEDSRLGTHVEAVGYLLRGAVYDARDRRVQLMLEGTGDGGAHLVHAIPDVAAMSVVHDEAQRDLALRIAHHDGHTLLSFPPDDAP